MKKYSEQVQTPWFVLKNVYIYKLYRISYIEYVKYLWKALKETDLMVVNQNEETGCLIAKVRICNFYLFIYIFSFISSIFIFSFFKMFLFIWEGAYIGGWGEPQRERISSSLPTKWAQSQMQGLISWPWPEIMTWVEIKSRSLTRLSHPSGRHHLFFK